MAGVAQVRRMTQPAELQIALCFLGVCHHPVIPMAGRFHSAGPVALRTQAPIVAEGTIILTGCGRLPVGGDPGGIVEGRFLLVAIHAEPLRVVADGAQLLIGRCQFAVSARHEVIVLVGLRFPG